MLFALTCLLVGMVLGQRFKVLVLIPAIALMLTLTTAGGLLANCEGDIDASQEGGRLQKAKSLNCSRAANTLNDKQPRKLCAFTALERNRLTKPRKDTRCRKKSSAPNHYAGTAYRCLWLSISEILA
jgi:hypothetical protein